MARIKQPTDFSLMTDEFILQAAYLDFKREKPVATLLNDSNIEKILGILGGKRETSLTPDTYELRLACQQIKAHREKAQQREVSLTRKTESLRSRLSTNFSHFEHTWKGLRESRMVNPAGYMAQRDVKARLTGLAINDLKATKTPLWTLDAMLNKVNGKDKDGNTDEHFHSLYANAGYEMLDFARERGVQTDIDEYTLRVFKFTQTIRATKKENDLLNSYHTKTKMVNPQTSYEECGVSQLVDTGIISDRYQCYMRLLNEYPRIDTTDAGPPFTNVITLEEAIRMHPELEKFKV